MRNRTVNDPAYVDVGVCERWNRFENFRDDMAATFFEGAVLGRYGDVGDYTPTNCRWITKAENTREMHELRDTGPPTPRGVDDREHRNQAHLMADGRVAIHVALVNGINDSTFYMRIHDGWTPDDAATVPLRWERYRMSDGRLAFEVARENGVSTGTMTARIKRLGWSVDDAASTPPRQKRRSS